MQLFDQLVFGSTAFAETIAKQLSTIAAIIFTTINALELNAVAQIVDLQKMNMPMAAPNISSVATDTTITLGIELGCSFISLRSIATKIMPRRRNGASRPLITAVQ